MSETSVSPLSSVAFIEARAISKTYGTGSSRVNAVQDVSFEVADGEFVSLLGPRGCGKTTLMMMLVGLTAADLGEARIRGQRVTAP